MNRSGFSIVDTPVKYKAEMIVRDNETGKIHHAVGRFTGETFAIKDKKLVDVNLVVNDDKTLWEVVIGEEVTGSI